MEPIQIGVIIFFSVVTLFFLLLICYGCYLDYNHRPPAPTPKIESPRNNVQTPLINKEQYAIV